jgi:hypothetical protein
MRVADGGQNSVSFIQLTGRFTVNIFRDAEKNSNT